MYYLLSLCYSELMDFKNALLCIDKSIELNSRNPTLYILRSDIYEALGKFTKSKEDIIKVIELFPNYLNNLESKANSYEKIGDTKNANRFFCYIKKVKNVLNEIKHNRNLFYQ